MRYDKYKSSGIDWIGDVPNHWSIKRIKDYATVYSGSSITNSELLDEGFEVYGGNGFMGYTNKHNVDDESIIIGRVGAKCGNVKLITERKWISDNALILKKIKRKDTYRYIAMLLDMMNLGSLSTSTAQPLVTGTKVLNQFILFPSLEEQTSIAQYLDAKTQAIDKKVKLLAKKADYYKELRKSLISDAVCKGLDKNIKMKESGIEWIGEIPEHWVIKRLKDIATIKGGQDFKDIVSDDGLYPVYGSGGIFDKATKFLYDKPSVLLGRKGTIDKPLFVNIPFWTVDTMYYTEIHRQNNARFFYYQCLTIRFDLFEYGSAVPSMTQRDLVNISFPSPPTKEEQTSIATYLDEKTKKIDSIVTNIGKQIETLKELRKTLINDVVTGKIKVTTDKEQ